MNLGSAEETAHEISRAGGRALALHVDVSKESSVERMIKRIVEDFGVPDVLYNNVNSRQGRLSGQHAHRGVRSRHSSKSSRCLPGDEVHAPAYG
jgi:NAD(P)-dependent dehydrogenase (short-subunit alcohol dehydrogenase family)